MRKEYGLSTWKNSCLNEKRIPVRGDHAISPSPVQIFPASHWDELAEIAA
jgi:hypothetical protein